MSNTSSVVSWTGGCHVQSKVLERHPAMSVRGGQVVEEEIPFDDLFEIRLE